MKRLDDTLPKRGYERMKIAICEDNLSDSRLLSGFLMKYQAAQSLSFAICHFRDGDSMIAAAQSDHDIQIIFMDILMSPTSGLDTARAIRSAGNGCHIIFTTESTDYYPESYEIHAQHYLVKPLTYERVCQALDRCRNSLLEAARCIKFTYNRVDFQVRVNDIRYIEVFKNTSYIHTDREYPVMASLDFLLERLNDSRFIRCHKSYAVNLSHIKKYENRQVILDDGSTIPISRSNATDFKESYGRFLTTQIMEGEL